MWSYRYLSRMDFRVLPVIFGLMLISLLVVSSFTANAVEDSFFTPLVKTQLRWFAIGLVAFVVVAGFDYNKLREWAWPLYLFVLLLLIGLFFTDPIQRVHRWYRLPLINFTLQPSECAKLAVVIMLSWFLERRQSQIKSWGTAFLGSAIVGLPFILILKQPDLGTALVLFPITLVMFYFGGVHPVIIKGMSWMTGIVLVIVACIFLNVVSHEEVRPYATKVLKDYQFERLNPNTHHQKAAATAIALGGLFGEGWRASEYAGGGWLPAPYTDSVFPAFGEEFGVFGLLVMLSLFYALIHFSFQVSAVASNQFGRLLSAGITVYLAIHVLVNIGMMSGLLPITGVPLILVTYGGSSIVVTMIALGILQSIYSRRFMF
ncbi:MAG: FtsW/RodA/SpoVE family cell cycle protein [Parachlamydiaceae bacterium]